MPKKGSKFDPYLEDIKDMMESGLSMTRICDRLYEVHEIIADPSAVWRFAYANGLRSKVTMGGRNQSYIIPQCSVCENCVSYKNDNLTVVRCCNKAMQVIARDCRTSPMWCVLRK